MDKIWSALTIALVMGMSLAGCADTSPPPTETTTTAPPAMGSGRATSVAITPPVNKAAGESTVVCWTIAGTGNVAHVAIHWDSESHAADPARTFADYDDGVAYPNNASALNAAGYNLPGRFCTAVTIPLTGTLYVVGHVIDANGAPGMLSAETTVKAVGGGTVLSIDPPTGTATGAPGGLAPLCWTVRGTGNIAHVAIHWDTASHASKSSRSFADYAAGVAYPDNAATLDRNGYDLSPAGTQFCASARLPSTGAIYVISHTIDRNGAPGMMSTETAVTVV
jgi:hypothetical protein